MLSLFFTTIVSLQAYADELYDPRSVQVFCNNESFDSESRCFLMVGHEVIFTTSREFVEETQLLIQKARNARHYIAVGNGQVYQSGKFLSPDKNSINRL